MSPDPLEVLGRLNLITSEDNKGLWLPPVTHVPELNERITLEFEKGLSQIKDPDTGTNPKGIVIRGQRGSGKTHFVRYARSRVENERGYFIVVQLRSGRHFWMDTLTGMTASLLEDGQLERLLRDLALGLGLPRHRVAAISGASTPTQDDVDDFVSRLVRQDRRVGSQAGVTARALILFAATGDLKLHEAGRAYLTLSAGSEAALRRGGIQALPDSPQLVVNQLSLLMARGGPTLFAIDQIDGLLQESRSSGRIRERRRGPSVHEQFIDQIAHGLMALREETHRSLTLLACLPDTWEEIDAHAIDTLGDRFIVPQILSQLPSSTVAQELVARRLAEHYRVEEFWPPHPTWPVHPAAFGMADRYTPRTLLERVEKHVGDCVEHGVVQELHDLAENSVVWPGQDDVKAVDAPDAPARAEPVALPAVNAGSRLEAIDRRWSELLRSVDPDAVLDPQHEDRLAPAMLTAALTAWGREQTPFDRHEYRSEPGQGRPPGVHARLRRIDGDEDSGLAQWSFRLLGGSHHKTVLARLPAAMDAAGLTSGRSLVVLRTSPWPGGATSVTQECVKGFRAAGGIDTSLSPEDARDMLALQGLLEAAPEGFDDWLRARQPAHAIVLFRKVLPGSGRAVDDSAGPAPPVAPIPATTSAGSSLPTPEPISVGTRLRPGRNHPDGDQSEPVVTLGRTRRDGRPFAIPLHLLRKHVLVVAGSGAGKTVLLKRLIEEVALQGVSSVVLDPNNDLSYMGERWPVPPQTWTPQDANSADTYFRTVEVVVWTPRRTAGRPLQFDPIPDLAAFGSDPDEFSAAVESAVSVLAPRANLRGTTSKAAVGRAVLTEALNFHGRNGSRGLESLIDLLEDLPDEATTFDDGHALARSMATSFRAARVTDPLFAADVPSTDPRQLLTPSEGKQARISVINFVGLHQLEQRQSFVSQLQLALFATFRRNPSRDPLGGLLVMDEAQDFVPPQGTTPSTASTLQLAAQARKFGLGIAFATQAPRGLHNQVGGNTATQFIGRLTHPTQIDAAEKLARARGGEVPDIARLAPGQFFAATEGTAPTRIAAAMSLSHHPDGPPTEEEILRLARETPPAPIPPAG